MWLEFESEKTTLEANALKESQNERLLSYTR